MTRQELYLKYVCDCKEKCSGKIMEQCAAEFSKDLDKVIKEENHESMRRNAEASKASR